MLRHSPFDPVQSVHMIHSIFQAYNFLNKELGIYKEFNQIVEQALRSFYVRVLRLPPAFSG